MNHRRLVGIDLGIATPHTVRVLDGEGVTVAKRGAWPTVQSLAVVEPAALAGCPGRHDAGSGCSPARPSARHPGNPLARGVSRRRRGTAGSAVPARPACAARPASECYGRRSRKGRRRP